MNWSTCIALPEIKAYGLNTTFKGRPQKKVILFREDGDNILLHQGPPGFQIILSKEDAYKVIDLSESKTLRDESQKPTEESFWEYYKSKDDYNKEQQRLKEEADSYNSLSQVEQRAFDKEAKGKEILSALKNTSKKDKIIYLHKEGFTKDEIQKLMPTDPSYMDEIYTKFIIGYN